MLTHAVTDTKDTCSMRGAQTAVNLQALLHSVAGSHMVRIRDSHLPGCCADLVTPYGYPLEQYTVPTRDGYLLGLFRIPHGAGATNSTDRWA